MNVSYWVPASVLGLEEVPPSDWVLEDPFVAIGLTASEQAMAPKTHSKIIYLDKLNLRMIYLH